MASRNRGRANAMGCFDSSSRPVIYSLQPFPGNSCTTEEALMRSNLGLRLASKVLALMAAAIPLSAQTAPSPNPDKNAYFGETHVHTSWSLDAFALGNTLTTPGDAYKYFQGEPIKHPARLRSQDRHAPRLGRRHRSLRVRRRRPAGERRRAPRSARFPQAQPLILKARTKEEMERVALYAINTLVERTAGPGPHVAGDRRHRLEEATSSSPTRPTSPASSRRSAPTSGRRCRTT